MDAQDLARRPVKRGNGFIVAFDQMVRPPKSLARVKPTRSQLTGILEYPWE